MEIRYGDRIESLTRTAGAVKVQLRQGQARKFDLVIGADGIHSATRRLAFQEGAARLHHLGHQIAVFSVPNRFGLDREEVTYVAPGRTALVYNTAGDHSATAMFLYADPHPSRHGRATDPRPGGERSDAEQRWTELVEVYRHDGWLVPDLLAERPAPGELFADALCQVHAPRWSNGRVALVGDSGYAASPASGQGTSLALVGGYVLAEELAATPDHEAAFRRYEQRMRPFVTANQRLGPANIGRMVLNSRGQIRATTAMLALMGRLPGHERLARALIAPIRRAANAIALPDD